jgi:iron complex outermembrane recepter protein
VDSDYTRSSGVKSKSYFKFNTSYQFGDDLLGYATFSQGFRRGGTNGFKDQGTKKVSDENAAYQPDSTNNFEVGLKGYALNRMLYVEADVYQIDWKNVQTYRAQDVNGFPVNGTANGPGARSRGFELSTRYKLNDNWQATYSTTTTQAEWTGTVVNCLYAGNATAECRTWSKGGKLGGSPKWKHNFGARFNTYLDNGTYLWASLSGRYTGPIAIDRADSPTESVRQRPAYTLLNANTGVSFGNWDANFWIQNLANKRAEVSAQEQGIMGARITFATPRTMGVNVTYNFK